MYHACHGYFKLLQIAKYCVYLYILMTCISIVFVNFERERSETPSRFSATDSDLGC